MGRDHRSALVRDFVIEHLADEFAVAVFDESAQEKKGRLTAGVKRQYAGCVGKVTNAVNVVYCTYATPRGHAIVGARPHLLQEWIDGPERRQLAGIAETVTFAAKPQLALGLLTDLHTAGKVPPWATGDEVYHRSAGPGSKGERRYAWAWVATTSPRHHLLIRRSLADPTELAYSYTWVPDDRPVTLPTLVRVAGMRWQQVAEDFQTGIGHFGLDHSQVRLYTAIR